MGKLTVTLAQDPPPAADAWDPGQPPIHEIDWARLEKPIQGSRLTSGYTGQPLQDGIDELEAWRNSPQQRRRRYEIPRGDLHREADPNTDSDWQGLGSPALPLAKKIAAGTESYLVFSPIISRTTVTLSRPATGGCGTIQAPPFAIAGYVYLKVADTARQQADGTWQRTEQWQGADKWDEDLYEKV
ncbi:MAG: hypothetical protein FWF28_06590, partial [Micrococcales bacterium]|nr:hypothetical protein [Micrococcales bacterium]